MVLRFSRAYFAVLAVLGGLDLPHHLHVGEEALDLQGDAHLREHVSLALHLAVHADGGLPAHPLNAPDQGRMDVVTDLDGRGRGDRSAAVDDDPKFVVLDVVAVGDVVVRPQEPLGGDGPVAAGHEAVGAAPDVGARKEAEVAGRPEIVAAHVERGIIGPEDGHGEGHQGVVAGKASLPQPADFGHRMRDLGEVQFPGFGLRLHRTVTEDGPDPRCEQGVDGGIAVGRRGVVVAPVENRRDARVDLAEGAHEGADEGVRRGCTGARASRGRN